MFKSQSLIRTPSSHNMAPIRRKVPARRGFCESNRFKRSCVVGLARDVSDDGDDKEKQNGFAFVSDKSLSMFQVSIFIRFVVHVFVFSVGCFGFWRVI